MVLQVLRIHSGARKEGSISRRLADAFCAGLGDCDFVDVELLEEGLNFVDSEFMAASALPEEDRTAGEHRALACSDKFIEQILASDVIVITAPLYNYGVPAVLKAWIDLINRAGVTFSYGPDGLETLVSDRPVIVCQASGGTPLGSEMDAARPQLKYGLAGIGLESVEFFGARDPRKKPDDEVVAEEARLRARAEAIAAELS